MAGTDDNLYASVSPLYGPGAVGAWWLLVLSYSLPYFFSPIIELDDLQSSVKSSEKRKILKIDMNHLGDPSSLGFLSLLTLPAVAAGDVILRVVRFSRAADYSSQAITSFAMTMMAPLDIVALSYNVLPFCLITYGLRGDKKHLIPLLLVLVFNLAAVLSGELLEFWPATVMYACRAFIDGFFVCACAIGLPLLVHSIRHFFWPGAFLGGGLVFGSGLGIYLASDLVPNLRSSFDGKSVVEALTFYCNATKGRPFLVLWPRTASSILDLDQAVTLFSGAAFLCYSIHFYISEIRRTRQSH